MTLENLIALAYNLTYGVDHQVDGGPDWIRSKPFDIEAKEEIEVAKKYYKVPPDQQGDLMRAMLQTLLADRFGLKVHSAPHELSTYTLIRAKGPIKLKPVVRDPHLPANIPANRIDVMGDGWLQGYDCDMALLSKVLASRPDLDGRTVVDKTGITGAYDFTLKWTPAIPNAPEADADAGGSADPSTSIFTALQEQLGVKLVLAKAQVNVIVIDSVEELSAN